MRKLTLDITTAADGSATVNSAQNIFGIVHAILYKPGTIDTGATITVTSQGIFANPLLTKASAGTADTMFYPRAFTNAVADGAAQTDVTLPVINGSPRVVVASGGSGGVGKVIIYYWAD